jgi:hypothetical protein
VVLLGGKSEVVPRTAARITGFDSTMRTGIIGAAPKLAIRPSFG